MKPKWNPKASQNEAKIDWNFMQNSIDSLIDFCSLFGGSGRGPDPWFDRQGVWPFWPRPQKPLKTRKFSKKCSESHRPDPRSSPGSEPGEPAPPGKTHSGPREPPKTTLCSHFLKNARPWSRPNDFFFFSRTRESEKKSRNLANVFLFQFSSMFKTTRKIK